MWTGKFVYIKLGKIDVVAVFLKSSSMTTCLGKSCSFDLRERLLICVYVPLSLLI